MGIKATIRTAAILSLFLLSGCGHIIFALFGGDRLYVGDAEDISPGRRFHGCDILNDEKTVLWLKHPDARCAEKSGHRRMRIPLEYASQCERYSEDIPPVVTLLVNYPDFRPLADADFDTPVNKRVLIGINDAECGSFRRSPKASVEAYKETDPQRYQKQSLDEHLTRYTPVKRGKQIPTHQYFTYEDQDTRTYFTATCTEGIGCHIATATKDNAFHYRIDLKDTAPEDFREFNDRVIAFVETLFF